MKGFAFGDGKFGNARIISRFVGGLACLVAASLLLAACEAAGQSGADSDTGYKKCCHRAGRGNSN